MGSFVNKSHVPKDSRLPVPIYILKYPKVPNHGLCTLISRLQKFPER